jgi:hypothetical protein
MEDLLGVEVDAEQPGSHSDRPGLGRSRVMPDWAPAEGGPLSIPVAGGTRPASIATIHESRFSVESDIPARSNGHESMYLREGELMSKLHDLLHSPIGNGVARILEELHAMLPRSRSSI